MTPVPSSPSAASISRRVIGILAGLIRPGGTVLYGDGPNLSNIIAGSGTASTPSLVQGFSGFVIAAQGLISSSRINMGNGLPNYGTPLVGATGRSLEISQYDVLNPTYSPATIILDDCYGWSTFLQWTAGALRLRFWFDVPSLLGAGQEVSIMGSNGPEQTSAIGVSIVSNVGGTALNFKSRLTTAASGLQSITSGDFAVGTHYIEVSYDGAHFWFYVDGVHQGNVAMTGRVDKKPWESVTIGNDFSSYQQLSIACATGSLFSVELGNVAGHTGTGSYTPPTSMHSADANTLWLFNGDIGDPPVQTNNQWPFLWAQCAITDGSGFGLVTDSSPSSAPGLLSGLVTHWCRINGWAVSWQNYYGPNFVQIDGIGLICKGNLSGIICVSSASSEYNNFSVSSATAIGFQVSDANSFFTSASRITISNVSGVGVLFASDSITHVKTVGCGVGFWLAYGDSSDVADQPAWNSYIPFFYGPSYSGLQFLHVISHSADEETACHFQKCCAYISLSSTSIFENCIFDTGLTSLTSNPAPCIEIAGLSANLQFTGCVFYRPAGRYSFEISSGSGVFSLSDFAIELQNCTQPFVSGPWSTIQGLITDKGPRSTNNQLGISTSSLTANNMVGEVDILHGFTTGRIQFPIPEPDADYILTFGYIGYEGSAPAAGSTDVVGYTNDADGFGFDVTVGADPGSDSQVRIGWHLIRNLSALYRDYLPSPGSAANPLAVPVYETGAFAAGVTLVPVGSNCIGYSSAGIEAVMGAGTPGAADSWEFHLNHGLITTARYGTDTPAEFDCFVDQGQLCSLLSPGPHNVVIGNFSNVLGRHINGWLGIDPMSGVFIDGGLRVFHFQPGFSTGTQQTPIYWGEHAGGTEVLATSTMRNARVAVDPAYAIVYEQDIGPQAGSTESAIFGDMWAFGEGATTSPSWATQIADARYPTGYYWMPVKRAMYITQDIGPDFWKNWGGNQSALQSICIAAGLNDIAVGGYSSTTVFASFTAILEGGPALCTVSPPQFNYQSWIILYNNLVSWGAGFTVTIDGVTFPLTFTTDEDTSWNNLANAINASSPTNTLVTAVFHASTGFTHASVVLNGLPLGSAGNAITIGVAGGTNVYPPGSTTMVGGVNATVTIEGTTFEMPFDTDAATSVNDVVALILADGPTTALVTPSNVGNHLSLIAVTAGLAGNAITVTTDSIGGAHVDGDSLYSSTLLGGFDGAIQKGIPNIVVTTVPPFGDSLFYTAPKEAERVTYNGLVAAYATAHSGDGVVLADVDLTMRNPGRPHQTRPDICRWLVADSVTTPDRRPCSA